MSTSFYTRSGESEYTPTPATAGPWGPDTQHAGPPSALIAREIETAHPRDGARLARVHIDVLGPIPLVPLTVRVRAVRPGRSVELFEATVSAGDRDVHAARAWRMLRVPGEVPAVEEDEEIEPVPSGADFVMPAVYTEGYLSAVEWRYSRGGFLEPGPCTAWLRPRIPLVDDEELAGWQRALVVADSGSGVGMPLDPNRYPAINCDLSVALFREPRSEWLRLDVESVVVPGGGALTSTRLGDEYGHIGTGSQALFARSVR